MSSSKKIRVAVLFGGRSTEYEVSLSSAVSILNAINRDKYDILPVHISKEGRWELITDSKMLSSVETLKKSKGDFFLLSEPKVKGFLRISDGPKNSAPQIFSELVDVVFPVLHGTFGEDGAVQGLLRVADLPFVGAGVLGSALGMDKIMMKQMFMENDLTTSDFIWFLRKKWKSKPDEIIQGVVQEIGFPCFVKPANTGSSVGVSKANSEVELSNSINKAARYDRKILIEKRIDAHELECSVLGNDDPKASVVGEVIPCNEFYDYEAKYLDDESETIIPADIPKNISEKIQRMAVDAFKALDCAGMARVDFLLERKTDQIFINEINTIPGFTPISMYPKLWEASGIPYSELIDRLIELALERHQDLNDSEFLRD